MKIRDDVLSKTVSGEEVLLDLENGNYFGLNPSATFIWQLVRNGESPENIARQLASEYDLSPSEAEADVLDFIACLRSEKLIG